MRQECSVIGLLGIVLYFSLPPLYTPTLRDADLDIWENGAWKTIHQWKDQYLHRLVYKGDRVTTDRLRIRPTKSRQGYGTWVYNEITDLGIYE